MSKIIIGNTVGTTMNPKKFGGGNGSAQPDMAQNDPAQPDYVKNRTHWEENNQTVIEWDGDTKGRRIFVVEKELGVEETYYKISDQCPEEEDVIGAAIVFSNGTTQTVTNKLFTGFVDGEAKVGSYLWLVNSPSVTEGNVIDYGVIGVYGRIANDFYPAAFTYGAITVHTLDEKFIPDTIARTTDITTLEQIEQIVEDYMAEHPIVPDSSHDVDLTGYAKETWVQEGFQPKGDYLESTELTNAVNTALAQAKENGDFDGTDGQDGSPGADGYTPVKGVDYYTEADKAEIVAEVANKVSACYIALPSAVHIKVGAEFRVYFRNILSLRSALLWVGSNSNLTTRYYDDYFSITPTAEGSHALNWKLYDEASNLLESGTLTVIATAKNASLVTRALVIGDSTVNAGTMTQKTIDLYAADGAKLSLLGSRGTSPNLHEGRGGWTAANYCTKSSDGTYDNPFYNNGFDFAYYMANRGYTGVQTVVIQLGINDVFLMKDTAYTGATVLDYINQMVTSILAYDSSIKIIINLPITPNSNGTTFTEAYGTTQLYWLYNRNSIRFSKELAAYFVDNPSVAISASNCVLDTKTQIRDGVHPTDEGYHALGQRLYEVLISIVDGVVVSLLSINDRQYVVNNGNTIAATASRDLDTTKCFATTTGGARSSAQANDTYEALGDNSLAYTTLSGSSGRGVEFPVSLEVGKTYTLSYTAAVNYARVYLMRYNADTTFKDSTELSKYAGTFQQTITPESGYLYAVMFTPLGSDVANVRCVWDDISLFED